MKVLLTSKTVDGQVVGLREVQLNAMAVRNLPLKRGICYDEFNNSEVERDI